MIDWVIDASAWETGPDRWTDSGPGLQAEKNRRCVLFSSVTLRVDGTRKDEETIEPLEP